MSKQGFVYILTNQKFGTIYIGVTSNLVKRIYEHKNKLMKGFSQKYDLTNLVYYEVIEDIAVAITREKQLKKFSRNKKLQLITRFNIDWKDLYDFII
jgi:putative endonuclease